MDNLPGPVILITGTRRVCYANSAAKALFDNIGLDADLALTIRHPQVLASVIWRLRMELPDLGNLPSPGQCRGCLICT